MKTNTNKNQKSIIRQAASRVCGWMQRRVRHVTVEWVVNDNAELGVKVGGDYHFLYKGRSIIYNEGLHDNDKPMHVRPVGKREFGECAYPINHEDYSKIGKVSLSDSSEWEKMPASTHPDSV